MRAYRQRVALTGIEGINEQHELATPNQLADCRNVWAQNGSIESRPGYQPVTRSYTEASASINPTDSDLRLGDGGDPESYTAPVGNVLTLDSAAVGNRLYVGNDDQFVIFRLWFNSLQNNSNSTTFKAEYYNGTSWMYLPVEEFFPEDPPQSYESIPNFLQGNPDLLNSGTYFKLPLPKDWATTTIDSLTKYWLRFEILDNALDSTVELDLTFDRSSRS